MPTRPVDPDEHGRSTTGATQTEPEPHLGGRRLHTPRGKVLGGSSSINGMVYIRGNPLDFDRWEEEGADGWAYADVLPYFRRAETRAEGGDAWRGGDGPLHTRYGALAEPALPRLHRGGRAGGLSGRPTTSTASSRKASAGWT